MAQPLTVFVTGANRGIGFELVKQLATSANPPEFIFATFRKREDAQALFDFVERYKSVRPVQLDVRDYSRFEDVAKDVSAVVGSLGINLLINNAGIMEDNKYIMDLTHEQLITTYEVNVISPLFLTKAFLPLLRTAVQNGHGKEFSWSQAAIVNVTSLLGSNQIYPMVVPGMHAYRMSKAALNMITKSLSIDLKADKILISAISPGWVQTDMGGKQAFITVQESVSKVINTISNLNELSNGAFMNNEGNVLPY